MECNVALEKKIQGGSRLELCTGLLAPPPPFPKKQQLLDSICQLIGHSPRIK